MFFWGEYLSRGDKRLQRIWSKDNSPFLKNKFLLPPCQNQLRYMAQHSSECRCGGVSDVKRMKELEEENARLKCMYANLAMDNKILQDLFTKKLALPPKGYSIPSAEGVYSSSPGSGTFSPYDPICSRWFLSGPIESVLERNTRSLFSRKFRCPKSWLLLGGSILQYPFLHFRSSTNQNARIDRTDSVEDLPAVITV